MMYPLATPRMPPWATRWFEEVFSMKESEASTRTLPTVRCENYSMLKRIVLASDCVSVALMDTIRTELNEGRLTAIAVEATTLTTNAGIVQVRGRTPSPLATAFVHQVEELARR